jgi:hypothetical protein
MKYIVFLILTFPILSLGYAQNVFRDQVFNEQIKSIELHPLNKPMGEALIFLNDPEPLLLKFDEIDADYQDYTYTFIHCDAQWKASDLSQNEYLDGYLESYITDYKFSKNTKVPYIHYSLQFPNSDIQFRYSGNYILKVYPEGKADQPLFTKRFYVVDSQCNIGGSLIPASNPEIRNTAQEINFQVNITNLHSQFPSREITTQIQQNGRFDNQINRIEPLSIKDGILNFNLQKGNTFPGLNTFRFFDFSNLALNSEYVYHIDQTKAIDEVELLISDFRARRPYKNEPTQFGKSYIETKNYQDSDSEAEYAFVQFLLKSSEELAGGDVYVLGDFDLWSMSHKMTYDLKSNLYHTKILLKQGYYSYLYAFKKRSAKQADVSRIEGSYFQTPNNYFIRVYYRASGTTYDRLVGWQEISNYEK